MKKIITPFLLISMLLVSCNSNTESESPETNTEESNANFVEIDSDEALIATALMAAPPESRDGCTVIGFNMAGEFVTFKEGTNQLICLADDPTKKGFNAACYHENLEPFMARGRELRAEGKSAEEIFQIREEEAFAGKLDMGGTGNTLHILYGPNSTYNPETSNVEGAQYRYVVYMPYATAESTGLPETPIAQNHPWIMNPGTHRAHIMISPINE